MRLTLRTLLAFMDDVLDPADQEDLARQIEQSERGTDMIHRTRDAMRRLRLGAPPVLGEGLELDPNYVAEYLDSTLSAEQMSEYQQVCLDSEVHLAEVASCHHILTMVLGEPAQVEPETRHRMYAIPQLVEQGQHSYRIDRPHDLHADDSVAPAVEEVAEVAPPAHHSPAEDTVPTEVPDYLRAGRTQTRNRMLVALAAIVVLGAATFVLFGPGGVLRDNGNVASNDDASNQDNGGAAVEDDAGTTANVADVDSTDDLAQPVEPAGDTDATEPESSTADEPVIPPAAESEGSAIGGDPLPPFNPEAENTPTDQPDMLNNFPEGVPDAPDSNLSPPPAGEGPVPPVAEGTPEGAGNNVGPMLPEGDGMTEPVAEAGEGDDKPDAETTPPDVPAAPAKPVPLGTLTTDNQILLRFDGKENDWMRLAASATINTGDRLLSLPTYRPAIALNPDLRLELFDGTMVALDHSTDGELPSIQISYGNLLLVNAGQEPARCELVIDNQRHQLEITTGSIFAIEVDRPYVPGTPSTETNATLVATGYAPRGGVTVFNDGAEVPLAQPSQWNWLDGPMESKPFDGQASWIQGSGLNVVWRNASQNVQREIDATRPAGHQLLEYYENSMRREDKAIAARCSTHVGQFIPFVEALADTNQEANWGDHIEDLRVAMARSPEAAQLVRETLVEQRGTEAGIADDLFEMLRGYSREQLGVTPEEVKTGILLKLINWLGHDRLEYRVLAFHNLKELTGKSLSYSPSDPRERNIDNWRDRLDDNELLPPK